MRHAHVWRPWEVHEAFGTWAEVSPPAVIRGVVVERVSGCMGCPEVRRRLLGRAPFLAGPGAERVELPPAVELGRRSRRELRRARRLAQ